MKYVILWMMSIGLIIGLEDQKNRYSPPVLISMIVLAPVAAPVALGHTLQQIKLNGRNGD